MPANLCTFTATAATMLIRSATGAGEFNGSLAGMGSAIPFAFSGDAPASYYDMTKVDGPVNGNPMMYIELPMGDLRPVNLQLAGSEVNKKLSSAPESYHNTQTMEASQALRFGNRTRIRRVRGTNDPKYPEKPKVTKQSDKQTKVPKEYRKFKYTLPIPDRAERKRRSKRKRLAKRKGLNLNLHDEMTELPDVPGQDDDVVSTKGASNCTSDTNNSQGVTNSDSENHGDRQQPVINLSEIGQLESAQHNRGKIRYRDGCEVEWTDKNGRRHQGTIVGDYYEGQKGKACVVTANKEFKQVRQKRLENPIIFAKRSKVYYKVTGEYAGRVLKDYDGTDLEEVVKVREAHTGEVKYLGAEELCHDKAWLSDTESVAATTTRIPAYTPQSKEARNLAALRKYRDLTLSSDKVLLYKEGTIVWSQEAKVAGIVMSDYYESMKTKQKVSVKIIAPLDRMNERIELSLNGMNKTQHQLIPMLNSATKPEDI